MKSFKALILLFTILSLTLLGFGGCIEPKVYNATEDKYFIFTLLEDGTYSISAKDKADIPEKVYLPKEYEGKAVTKVAAEGFMSTDIVELCLPETIKVVGANAFNDCKKLSKIYFFKGLEELEKGAFYGCIELDQLNLPSTLKFIGESAFAGISITRLDLPEKVQTIGASAFAYCERLASVYIGHNVKEIAENAFNGVSEAIEFEISPSNDYYRLVDGKIVKINN